MYVACLLTSLSVRNSRLVTRIELKFDISDRTQTRGGESERERERGRRGEAGGHRQIPAVLRVRTRCELFE